jgi:hypothetical protein
VCPLAFEAFISGATTMQDFHSAGTRAHAHPYRKHSVFILDETPFLSRVDRNLAAKIMRAAEIFERQSKLKGRARGALGYTGLALLRALLYRYSRPGRITSPCYATLERVTGLSRGAICEALKRLQASKLLVVVRRIVRRQVERISPWTGLPEMYVGTLQAANVYQLALPRFLALSPMKPVLRDRDQSPSRFAKEGGFDFGDAFSFDRILARRQQAGVTSP